jgi:hypothetical protein
MRFFDEDTPSDLHAIDRLLALRADELVQPDLADEPEIALLQPLPGSRASRGKPQRRVGDAEQESDVLAVIGEPAFGSEQPSIGAAAERDQSASIAAAVLTDESAAQEPASIQVGPEMDGPPTMVPGSPLAAAVALRSPEQASASKGSLAAHPGVRRRPWVAPIAAARSTVVQALLFVNLPLQALPATLRPTVNMLAITLALWAPAVWFMAPWVAAQASAKAAGAAASAEPAHHESSLRNASPPADAAKHH